MRSIRVTDSTRCTGNGIRACQGRPLRLSLRKKCVLERYWISVRPPVPFSIAVSKYGLPSLIKRTYCSGAAADGSGEDQMAHVVPSPSRSPNWTLESVDTKGSAVIVCGGPNRLPAIFSHIRLVRPRYKKL